MQPCNEKLITPTPRRSCICRVFWTFKRCRTSSYHITCKNSATPFTRKNLLPWKPFLSAAWQRATVNPRIGPQIISVKVRRRDIHLSNRGFNQHLQQDQRIAAAAEAAETEQQSKNNHDNTSFSKMLLVNFVLCTHAYTHIHTRTQIYTKNTHTHINACLQKYIYIYKHTYIRAYILTNSQIYHLSVILLINHLASLCPSIEGLCSIVTLP